MGVELWLVRHGETPWSREGRLAGWSDLELTPGGQAQALALRPWLSTGLFTAVYSSDLCRAVDTARLAYGEPRLEPRLRELNFGRLEGLSWGELEPAQQAALTAFEGFVAPGGESAAQLWARLEAFFGALPSGRYLCFTHGGPIRAVLRRMGQDLWIAPGAAVGLDWGQKRRLEPEALSRGGVCRG